MNRQEKVFAIDLIFLSAIKKRGDFSLPPSPHRLRLIDSLQFYEHLIVEFWVNGLILYNLPKFSLKDCTQFNHNICIQQTQKIGIL